MLHALWKSAYRKIATGSKVKLGADVQIGIGSKLWAPRGLTVGESTYIGRWCSIEADGSIGRDVLIANGVGIVGRLDHDFHAANVPIRRAPWVGGVDYSRWEEQGTIEIGDDVWIGYGAIVLTRSRIGRGAVIAAGSVVIGDIPPYEIWAGNPARHVGSRFSADQIPEHEATLERLWSGAG